MERSTIMESTFCCGGGGGLLTDDLMEIRIKGAMPRMQALKGVEKTDAVNTLVAYFAVSFSTDASSTSSDGASSVCGLSIIIQTPPCQGSCPSGHNIRGWLDIVRGMEKPSGDLSWQEYAFRRSTDANPFPSVMGRVCPAPCEDGCNRNEVEDTVGINAVEQFIGDTAKEEGYKFEFEVG
jgi:hypothetical protein